MKKIYKLTVLLLGTVLLCTSLFSTTSFAGASYTIVDESSFAEKINNADWNNPEKDVLSEDNKLVFPETSTKYTRLISKVASKKSEWLDNVYDAEFIMKIKKMPADKEFVLASGLAGIESKMGQKGNVELVFTNKGGISVALRVFEKDGEAKEIASAKKISASLGSDIQIKMSLKAEQAYAVSVNGTTIFSGKLPVSGEGRFGFLQTGNCYAEVSKVMLKLHSYDKPQNSNIEEKFDDGAFDKSLLTNNMLFTYKYYPTWVGVDEENGESVFRFYNAANSYLGTRYEYSNFEMTFDVPYVQREAVVAEDGTVEIPKNPWIGVTFGDETAQQEMYGYQKAADMIVFGAGSEIKSSKPETTILANLSGTDHAFYDEKETRGFSIKLKLVDAHMEIGIKWIDETEFETVASYDLPYGNTPSGYIHIWCLEVANYAIDNLVIKNLDKEPNLIETEYVSSKVVVPADFDYQELKMEYNTETTDGVFNWYLLIPCSVVIATLCVVLPVVILKAKKGRGQNKDEEKI